jgi:deoxyadenosine/deoxycytidine kinase
MSEIKSKLSEQHNIIIFPEGTRGTPGEIQAFKSGIGKIAEQFPNINILPVFISGTERSLPKQGIIPVPIWNNLIIGPPQIFKESYEKFTHMLENIIHEFAANESLSRHRRKRKSVKTIKTIAVLGIDGSGKSTLSKNLSKILSDNSSVGLVSDELNFFENGEFKQVQPLITENIRNIVGRYAKNAKSLKLYKIPKLTELILRDILLVEIKKWYHPDLVILDGSPLLNLSAWAILYKEKFFTEDILLKAIKILSSQDENIRKDDPIFKNIPELSALKKLGLTHLNLPDLVIFLDVEPQIAIERIEKRAQKRQVHETEEKLSKLRFAYVKTCNVINQDLNIPTYVLAGNDRLQNITKSAVKFARNEL